jgi:hypothetical protein
MFSEEQLKRKDIDTLRRWLLHKLGGYMIAVKDMPQGQRLYRGVQYPERPQKISRISYPPADIAPFNASVGLVSQNSIAAQAVPPFSMSFIRGKAI